MVENMRNSSAQKTALSGLLAALAVTIMCIGGIIPIATYVCPVICMVLSCLVLSNCGKRYAWICYVSICILSLILAPDKEAAMLYVFLGYYPLIKVHIEKTSISLVLKFFYFNAAIFLLYGLLIFVMGLSSLYAEFTSAGIFGLAMLIILGNITFFLLDKALSRFLPKR